MMMPSRFPSDGALSRMRASKLSKSIPIGKAPTCVSPARGGTSPPPPPSTPVCERIPSSRSTSSASRRACRTPGWCRRDSGSPSRCPAGSRRSRSGPTRRLSRSSTRSRSRSGRRGPRCGGHGSTGRQRVCVDAKIELQLLEPVAVLAEAAFDDGLDDLARGARRGRLTARAVAGGHGEARPEKILGSGELGHALTVKAQAFSASARTKIEAAGGSIIKPIFSFPGGRRFHFGDPNGNEYAVWSDIKA